MNRKKFGSYDKLNRTVLCILIIVMSNIQPKTQSLRVFKDNNHFGYKDHKGEVKLKANNDIATPLIHDFVNVDIESFQIEELLTNYEEGGYFLNPVGIFVTNDSIGLINYKGDILMDPIKCRIISSYQAEEMKFIENLEPESKHFGKFALIFKSGMHISPFIFCDSESWEDGYGHPHMRFLGENGVKDIITFDCEGRKLFMNQSDGFSQFISDTTDYTLINNGYYIVHTPSRLSLYHNDKFVRYLSVSEKINRIEYADFGVLVLTNEEGVTTLMDTTGTIIYQHPKGDFYGINGHGHARFCDEETCTYVDIQGKLIKKTGINEIFSTEEGYNEYIDSELVEYDKNFKALRKRSLNEDIFDPEMTVDYEIYKLLCQNDDFILALKEMNFKYPQMILRHSLEQGKYTFIEIKAESRSYFFKECSVEPFFPDFNTYSFEYKGNDIFYLSNDDYLSVYHAEKGWIKNFDEKFPEAFIYKNKTYYALTSFEEASGEYKTKIFDSNFTELTGEFRNFELHSNFFWYFPNLSYVKKNLYFQLHKEKEVIPFNNMAPELAFRNAKFIAYRDFTSSSSVFLQIRDTFLVYLIEINFPDIIERPEIFSFNQYTIHFDDIHNEELVTTFLNGSPGINNKGKDSLLCFDMNKGDPPCFNVFNKKIIKGSEEVLFPETSLFYYNRKLSIKDCFYVGYIDRNGNEVIPHHYTINDKTSFKYGTAIVTKQIEQKIYYGLIDTSGNFLIPLMPCRLSFEHEGDFVVSSCHNEDQQNVYYLYDTFGRLLYEAGYLSVHKDFIVTDVKNGGYHIYIKNDGSFFDVDNVNSMTDSILLKDVRVEIAGLEYKIENMELVKVKYEPGQPNKEIQILLKSGNFLCNGKDAVYYFNSAKEVFSVIPGTINSVDYQNDYVWVNNTFGKKTLVDFNGITLFTSNHSDHEYYSNCNCFMGKNYNGDFGFYYLD